MTTSLTPNAGSLDDLLSGFFVRPVTRESRGERSTSFRIDVYETQDAYRVVADLPGIRKEDINISVVGADLTISAEAKREQVAGDGEHALLQERFAGKYHRMLSLGHEIDESKAQARHVNGVLELTLPKSANSLPKRITIQ
jgi:HSP20 family protein